MADNSTPHVGDLMPMRAFPDNPAQLWVPIDNYMRESARAFEAGRALGLKQSAAELEREQRCRRDVEDQLLALRRKCATYTFRVGDVPLDTTGFSWKLHGKAWRDCVNAGLTDEPPHDPPGRTYVWGGGWNLPGSYAWSRPYTFWLGAEA